jgi:Fur family ferric uptake transcriptional regulator
MSYFCDPMNETELLRHHQLRITVLRLEVLRLLRTSERAQTIQDLAGMLTISADRVSLFRTLNAFEEAGLVHRVMDSKGTSCYAACGKTCGHGHHQETHAHFRCDVCGYVYCLNSVALPQMHVPKGFKLARSKVELEGTCKACQ